MASQLSNVIMLFVWDDLLSKQKDNSDFFLVIFNLFNPFMPSVIFFPYNFEFKGCWVVIYNFIQILKVHSAGERGLFKKSRFTIF